MASYVLIHGGAEGAWCWDPVLPLLSSQTQDVVAVDLPGFGARQLAKHDHITLADSIATVVEVVHDRGLSDVVLVGHSFGSVTAVAASPSITDRLRRLVLLGGMVPFEGVSAADMLRLHFDGEPSELERMEVSPDSEVFSTDQMDQGTAEWFYRMITPAERRPGQPLRSPVYPSRVPAHVPITYVVQALDRSLSEKLQRRSIANLPRPPDDLLVLDSPRNPMIFRPRETAEILLRYA